MEPTNARCYREHTDECNDEAAQALAATNQRDANDVLTVRPNREETTLNDWEMSFAIHQRFGTLDKLLQLPDGRPNCLAPPRSSPEHTLPVAATAASAGTTRWSLHTCGP